MEFVEASLFTRILKRYLGEEDYRALQWQLWLCPRKGDVIPGTGGLRKLRIPDPRARSGSRGGLRVIYLYLEDVPRIVLFTLYRKGEVTDLTPEEKRKLRAMAQRERAAARRGKH